MKMKLFGGAVCVAVLLVVAGRMYETCPYRRPAAVPKVMSYEDGTYRGVFIDKDDVEINVEFTLAHGTVTAARFRHLRHAGGWTLDAEAEPVVSVVRQYQEALAYLVGKDLRVHLPDLYHPGNIVNLDVDGFSGATIRGAKIISAIRDGLNRGVYRY